MEEPLITIIYKLADGKRIKIEVTSEVGDALEQSDRQIRSQRRQDRRFLKYTGYIAEFADSTMAAPDKDTADLLIRMDSYHRLYAALEKLSELQKRRLSMYYFMEMTYRQIAAKEGVAFTTAARSVERAIDKLKTHFG